MTFILCILNEWLFYNLSGVIKVWSDFVFIFLQLLLQDSDVTILKCFDLFTSNEILDGAELPVGYEALPPTTSSLSIMHLPFCQVYRQTSALPVS